MRILRVYHLPLYLVKYPGQPCVLVKYARTEGEYVVKGALVSKGPKQ